MRERGRRSGLGFEKAATIVALLVVGCQVSPTFEGQEVNCETDVDCAGLPGGTFTCEEEAGLCVRVIEANNDADEDEPAIVQFDVEPLHARPGKTNVLVEWRVEDVAAVTLEVDPASTVSPEDLDECTRIDEAGEGNCRLLISGEKGVSVVLTLWAHGDTEGVSISKAQTMSFGDPPKASFTAVGLEEGESVLPAAGDDVKLEWVAADAGWIRIRNTETDEIVLYAGDEEEGVCLNTGFYEKTCDPRGDVHVVREVGVSTNWIFTAGNNYGQTTRMDGVEVADDWELRP